MVGQRTLTPLIKVRILIPQHLIFRVAGSTSKKQNTKDYFTQRRKARKVPRNRPRTAESGGRSTHKSAIRMIFGLCRLSAV